MPRRVAPPEVEAVVFGPFRADVRGRPVRPALPELHLVVIGHLHPAADAGEVVRRRRCEEEIRAAQKLIGVRRRCRDHHRRARRLVDHLHRLLRLRVLFRLAGVVRERRRDRARRRDLQRERCEIGLAWQGRLAVLDERYAARLVGVDAVRECLVRLLLARVEEPLAHGLVRRAPQVLPGIDFGNGLAR